MVPEVGEFNMNASSVQVSPSLVPSPDFVEYRVRIGNVDIPTSDTLLNVMVSLGLDAPVDCRQPGVSQFCFP